MQNKTIIFECKIEFVFKQPQDGTKMIQPHLFLVCSRWKQTRLKMNAI